MVHNTEGQRHFQNVLKNVLFIHVEIILKTTFIELLIACRGGIIQ